MAFDWTREHVYLINLEGVNVNFVHINRNVYEV